MALVLLDSETPSGSHFELQMVGMKRFLKGYCHSGNRLCQNRSVILHFKDAFKFLSVERSPSSLRVSFRYNEFRSRFRKQRTVKKYKGFKTHFS